MPAITQDLGSWAALLGILLPALVALLQRDTWSSQVNSIIFAVSCVVASVVYGYIRFGSDFTWAKWEETLLAVVVWGIATYHTYWKPSGHISALRKMPRTAAPAPPAA